MTFTSGDEGAHTIKLHFRCRRDAPLPSMDIPVEVAMPEDTHFGTRISSSTSSSFAFAAPGCIPIDVTLGERTIASVLLMVQLIQSQTDESEKVEMAE